MSQFQISILFHLQVLDVRRTLTNVIVTRVNMVEHVWIRWIGLPATVHLDSPVNFLPWYARLIAVTSRRHCWWDWWDTVFNNIRHNLWHNLVRCVLGGWLRVAVFGYNSRPLTYSLRQVSGDRCVRLGLWSVSQSVSGGHKTDHKTNSCDRAYKFCDS